MHPCKGHHLKVLNHRLFLSAHLAQITLAEIAFAVRSSPRAAGKISGPRVQHHAIFVPSAPPTTKLWAFFLIAIFLTLWYMTVLFVPGGFFCGVLSGPCRAYYALNICCGKSKMRGKGATILQLMCCHFPHSPVVSFVIKRSKVDTLDTFVAVL